jgi:ABC-type sugar transport system ATPase subunit
VWVNQRRKLPATPAEALGARMAYVSEDRKGNGLVLNQSIRSNLLLPHLAGMRSRGGWLKPLPLLGADHDLAGEGKWARELKLKAASLSQNVGELSGGNQQKVVLAKWLLTEPDVFFLDEPTRGIDVGAKVEIYQWIQKLAAQGMGIIVASSEMPELLGVCHRVLVLREGHLTAEFPADRATQEEILKAASL